MIEKKHLLTVLIIALCLAGFMAVIYTKMNTFLEKTQECRHLINKEEVNFQVGNGVDQCCYNLNKKYTCFELDKLRKGIIEPLNDNNANNNYWYMNITNMTQLS